MWQIRHALPWFRATLTGCEGRIVRWEPVLLVERPAQAAVKCTFFEEL